MIKKYFANIFIFLVISVIISLVADIYYYNRVAQKGSLNEGQISYSDFRVLWFAAYNLKHHILKIDVTKPRFKPLWFLSSKWRSEVTPTGIRGELDSHKIYNKDIDFYYYRYSPFVAFIMMPLGNILHQGHALVVWYIILNATFLLTLFLIKGQISKDFGLSDRYQQCIILWGLLLGTLRFYLLNISLGQTDVLIVFLFVLLLMAYIRNKEIICGIIFALILQFKFFFLPMLIYFLLIGKRKIVISTITAFVTFLFIPAYALGIKKTISLLGEWAEILGISVASQILNQKNQSIIYAIGNLLSKSTIMKKLLISPINLFYLVSGILTLSSYVTMIYFRKHMRKQNEKKYKYLELSLLIIVSLLFSPIVWKSYFINLVIPLGVALFFTMRCAKRQALYGMLGAFFILACIIGTDLTAFIPNLNSHLMNITIGTISLAFAIIYAYEHNR